MYIYISMYKYTYIYTHMYVYIYIYTHNTLRAEYPGEPPVRWRISLLDSQIPMGSKP